MKTTKPELDVQPDQRRRKLFRGVSGGVGVLMAVQAKTALGAGVCASPSAILSGNTSPRPSTGITCTGGRSPGFWKVPNHKTEWPAAGAEWPKFSTGVVTCATNGMKKLELSKMTSSGTTLAVAGFSGGFMRPSELPVGVDPNLWAVLAFPGSFGSEGDLLRHLAAAWLNAGRYTAETGYYPVSRTEINKMWNARGSGLYYPPGVTSPSQAWSKTQVIDYIEGLYDINEVDPLLCEDS